MPEEIQNPSYWGLLEHLFDAIAVVDANRSLVFANERFRILANLPINLPTSSASDGTSGVSLGKSQIDRLLGIPSAVWESINTDRTLTKPVLDSTSFSFSSGARGFAQVMIQPLVGMPGLPATPHFMVVLRDITLELQNKWRLTENEKIITGLRRSHSESQFLWRLSLETPIYIDPSVVLTSVARRLRDELEFSDACFMRMSEKDDTLPEPLLVDSRIGSRLREVAGHIAPRLREIKARTEIWSFNYEDLGTFWVLNFRPKSERPFFLLARTSPISLEPDRKSFLEPLGMQISAWLDNRSMYLSSITDKLTGIFNRRQFDSRFAIECVLARERQTALSLILVDIDHFKKINDSFGHPLGDEVLRSMGETLKNVVRNTDVSARVGGEEFAVILHDTNARDAIVVAEKIRKAVIAVNIAIPGFEKGINITVSCGVAGYGNGRETPESLYAAADEALYRAKANGRNCTESTVQSTS